MPTGETSLLLTAAEVVAAETGALELPVAGETSELDSAAGTVVVWVTVWVAVAVKVEVSVTVETLAAAEPEQAAVTVTVLASHDEAP